jgi:nitrate/nitrite transport system substrate-binding protein
MSNDETKAGVSRRRFLKQGAAALGGMAAMSMLPAEIRAAVWTGGNDKLEKTDLELGFVPLTDCAPLAVALHKGYFDKYGLNVKLSREPSWSNIRDKVAAGLLDGAQMLAGMPIATTLGLGPVQKHTITAFSMDLNGNGITVSNELYQRMCEADSEAMQHRPITARALKRVIEQDQAAGREPMTFAMVFPLSNHNYQLRYWMAAAGIDPDKDVELVVIPPPQMVDSLAARQIDGYCVGEPWNEHAVRTGIGRTVITSYEIWNNGPEKVFGVNQDWAEQHPYTHVALLMALMEATRWMDSPANRMEVVDLIASDAYLNIDQDSVKMSMMGDFQYGSGETARSIPDFNVFHRYAANYPWLSHAEWFITQMYRWGQIDRVLNIREAAAKIYRPDIYRQAAGILGEPHPTGSHKPEGSNAVAWQLLDATQPITMGADQFLDGKLFDPARPVDYLAGFDISHSQVSLEELARANS